MAMHSRAEGKHILVVRIGGATRHKLYHAVKNLGVRLSCANPVISKGFNDVIDNWVTYSSEDSLTAVEKELLQKFSELNLRFDAVVTFDEFGVQLASMLAASLSLPGIPLKVVQCCQNKSSFRQFCKSRELPCVNFASLSCSEGVDSLDVQYPVVIKPRNGAGSHFVQRAESKVQLRSAMLGILHTLKTRRLTSYEWCDYSSLEDIKFHVEELVEGKEVDIDCVVCDNQIRYCNVVDNKSTGRPFFLEDTCQAPSSLSPQVQAQLCALAARILEEMARAWQCRITGTFHVEMILSEHGPVPIEVNCRLGGAETRCLHLAAWGVDLGVETVLAHMSLPSPRLQPFAKFCGSLRRNSGPLLEALVPNHRFACSANLHPSGSGIVNKIDLPLNKFGYVDHMVYFQVGEPILVPPKGFQYLGWVVVQAKSEGEARENLQKFVGSAVMEVRGGCTPAQEDS